MGSRINWSWIFSWLLFSFCTSGLLLLGYQEYKKFLDEPEVMDFSTKYQYEVDLPVFTFCPLGQQATTPPPLNIEILEKCGLTNQDILEGSFLGTGSSECTNPEDFWESVPLKLSKLGLKDAWIIYNDGYYEQIKIDQNASKTWKRQFLIDFNGQETVLTTCFELTLPKRRSSIMNFKVILEENKTLKVYVHHKGFLNFLHPSTSRDFVLTILTGDKSHATVKYFEDTVLKDQFGNLCTANESYDWANDIMQQTEVEVEKEFGCGTPFGLDKSKLCKAKIGHEKYFEAIAKVHRNGLFLLPCKFLSGFELFEKKPFEDGWHVFTFPSYVLVSKTRYAYFFVDLFADFGGYLGIFLGTSIFQLKDGLPYLINKFK